MEELRFKTTSKLLFELIDDCEFFKNSKNFDCIVLNWTDSDGEFGCISQLGYYKFDKKQSKIYKVIKFKNK